MSIDARVNKVIVDLNGSGYLELIDRPKTKDAYDGIAGQSVLIFDSAPDNVATLEGKDIWGGSSEIMLDDKKIAKRLSYRKIKFIVKEI